jgi:hypothetical protein
MFSIAVWHASHIFQHWSAMNPMAPCTNNRYGRIIASTHNPDTNLLRYVDAHANAIAKIYITSRKSRFFH